MQTDTAKWSGEGTFTQVLIDVLRDVEGIDYVRVEDAPATRSEADYNFISNEIYVAFVAREQKKAVRRFGWLPGTQTVLEKQLSLAQLETVLTARPEVGPADYSDGGMIQFLKTERIVQPYQTRGYKLVELVRVYEVGAEPRR